MAKQNLTREQTDAFDEVETTLTRAFDEARSKMAAVGFRSEDDFTSCTLCDCEGFIHQQGTSLICKRPTCRHSFFRHNVW